MGLQPDPVDRSAAYPDGRVNDPATALLKFLTGYLVELSLSADNVFVIAMLFSYFAIPRIYQHRVLFWGILGALMMRGIMIAIGAQLVSRFAWVLSIFGVVLILTAAKMLFWNAESSDPGKNVIVRLMRRFLPLTNEFREEQFFVRATPHGGWLLTPLVPALVMIEITDLVFAVDSIPAIFAVTADPFLVFTSNVFAILGLRSLYFALAGALHAFRYLKEALAIVLLTVGIKMLAHDWFKRVLGPEFNMYLLIVVVVILGMGVLASLVELKWRQEIIWGFGAVTRKLQAWIVPDHLITTIAKAGRRSVSARAALAERRRQARAAAARASALTAIWRRFFGRNARNMPILLIHQLVEDAGVLAIYL
jgi:tellurite resistance protein TerC